jgi:hypothetical protein
MAGAPYVGTDGPMQPGDYPLQPVPPPADGPGRVWLPGGVLAGPSHRPDRADDVMDPAAALDAAQAAILASQGVPRDLYGPGYRPRYGAATTPADRVAAAARRSEPADAPVSRPNAQNPPFHAFDDTPADAPQSEPSQEEHVASHDLAPILSAVLTLSNSELQRLADCVSAIAQRALDGGEPGEDPAPPVLDV